jgi:predicted Rossmann fold nucleotide-binding protein DprA/Smf involved in DNA uptake
LSKLAVAVVPQDTVTVYPDELSARLRLSPAELSAALARLELAGEICRDGHGRWMPGSAARAR